VGESAVGDPGDARASEPVDAVPDPELTVVCRQVVELVTDYLEGALPSRLRAAVEQHLELCPPCVVYVEQIRTTAASLRRVPVESMDPGTRAELVSAFRELIPKSGGGPR
jgi:anti-sigma factor RsiW